MVPASLVTAVHEHGWLALLITPDAVLASEPEEVLRLLDGLIIPAWAARADAYAEISRPLADAAEGRGLPVVRIVEGPDATVEDYSRAIGGLFTTSGARVPGARVRRA